MSFNRNFHPSLSIIALALASCKFSRFEFSAGSERPDRVSVYPDPEPAGSGADEISPVHVEKQHSVLPAGNKEVFPFEITEFAPQTLLPIAGYVQSLSSPHTIRSGAVFVDSDGNGENSAGDIFIDATREEGYFSGFIPLDHIDKPLLAFIEEPGETKPVVTTLRAPAGSSIISPLTELLVEAELTPAEISEILHLPYNIDITQFDPYHMNEDPAFSCRVLAAGRIAEMVIARETSDFVMAVKDAFSGYDFCSILKLMTAEDLRNMKASAYDSPDLNEVNMDNDVDVMAMAETCCGLMAEIMVDVV
ncbi:MAG: hypothetical protein EBT93_11510 [Alphaproteobacteria bacterium]|nr:hypothetical protein [Alphaproteobacteria bacterium]